MDDIFDWDRVAGSAALLDLAETFATRSALPELLEAAVLPLVEATPGCAALPEFLEAAEEKKLRRAVAGSSALLQLVCRSVLSELLRAAEAGRFMAALDKNAILSLELWLRCCTPQ